MRASIERILKQPWRAIALFLIWLAFALLAVELMMIVLDPLLGLGMFQYDPELGFRVRPFARASGIRSPASWTGRTRSSW